MGTLVVKRLKKRNDWIRKRCYLSFIKRSLSHHTSLEQRTAIFELATFYYVCEIQLMFDDEQLLNSLPQSFKISWSENFERFLGILLLTEFITRYKSGTFWKWNLQSIFTLKDPSRDFRETKFLKGNEDPTKKQSFHLFIYLINVNTFGDEMGSVRINQSRS